MLELWDIIKTVLAILAVVLLAGMLWLIVTLYNRTAKLQEALKVTTVDDFSGISTYPATVATTSYIAPVDPRYYDGTTYDPRYFYGDTFNNDPRYSPDPRYPYGDRYVYNPPRYYRTPNGGYYFPTTYPQTAAATVATTVQ